MATIAELKSLATELELPFKSKITKPELEELISAEQERRTEEHNRRFVQANSSSIPMHIQIRRGLARPKAPRNVPLTIEQRERNFLDADGQGGRQITPKQAKRMRKKFNRNAA